MAAHVPRLSGVEWQDWANRILSTHYGPMEYQQIPDSDSGDAGIEGFTRTEGHAYQAYGCQEPIGTRERYEKQRDKMTEDVGKFINNHSTLRGFFGAVKITRWALFVPYFNSKEIVSHAAKKTDEVRAAGLSYVASSFHVCVCQQSDFAAVDQQLINSKLRRIQIKADQPTPKQIAQWEECNQGPLKTLREKLLRLPTLRDDAERDKFHSKILDWYLSGQEILDSLRAYPETYAKLKSAKSHRESFLIAGMVSGSASHSRLTQSINELRAAFEEEVGELHKFSAESLAYEAVADWLLRCPLDFPVIQS